MMQGESKSRDIISTGDSNKLELKLRYNEQE